MTSSDVWENAVDTNVGVVSGRKRLSDISSFVSELIVRYHLNANHFTHAIPLTGVYIHEHDDIDDEPEDTDNDNEQEAVSGCPLPGCCSADKEVQNIISANQAYGFDHTKNVLERLLYKKCACLTIATGNASFKSNCNTYALNYKTHKQEILDIIITLFEKIAALHEQHVVHGDIKFSNFIYSKNNEVVFTDFGTSFIIDDKMTKYKTFPKLPPYTPPYPSPEGVGAVNYQGKTADEYDIGYATDVFVTGLLAWQMLNEFEFPAFVIKADKDAEEQVKKSSRVFHTEEGAEQAVFTSYTNIVKTYFQNQTTAHAVTPPKHGSKELQEIILSCLTITPCKRPTAQDVLDRLKALKTTPGKEEKQMDGVKQKSENGTNIYAKGDVIIKEKEKKEKKEKKTTGGFNALVLVALIIVLALVIICICFFVSSSTTQFLYTAEAEAALPCASITAPYISH